MAWNFPAPAPLAPFGCWPYTMVIPKFYWDAESQEQRVKYLCMLYDKLMAYVDALKDNVNVDSEAIAELQDAFQKFMESGFDDYYAEQVEQWIGANLEYIFETVAKQVFFGLTSDGYFCAYVPKSWSEIQFDTGAVYGTLEYGRLILRFDAEGSGIIDNTGYDSQTMQSIMQRLALIEKNLGFNNKTLYDPINGASVKIKSTGKRIANPLS